jgi:hypothetical protein
MACCNIDVGLTALVNKTAVVFIYLNLLLALTEYDEHAKLLRPSNSLEEYKSSRMLGSLVRLLPRPAYMNTQSFARMFSEALGEHGHAVEHVLFNPLFAPRPSGRRSKWLSFDGEPAASHVADPEEKFERDAMADRQSLGEALKQMWKVLIFCDMAFREAGEPINWEYASLDAIAELFRSSVHKLVGQDWDYYELEREEEGPFAFYANASKR